MPERQGRLLWGSRVYPIVTELPCNVMPRKLHFQLVTNLTAIVESEFSF